MKEQNPLIAQVTTVLDSTPVERWIKGGEELDSSRRYSKMRRSWERVYCIRIKQGVLVFRSSLSISTSCLGGGFKFTPTDKPKYTVEIRAKGWNHREITDPEYRLESADKRCDILAKNSAAGQLFEYVSNKYESFYEERRKEFVSKAENLFGSLRGTLERRCKDFEKKEDRENDATIYKGVIDGCKLKISRRIKNDNIESYEAVVSQNGNSHACRQPLVARQLFEEAEEMELAAGLEKLHNVLTSIA